MEQISKAKAEIQMARRSLQMVSKQVGGGVTKTEHAAAELGDEDGLEQDLEEQSLLKKAQTLPEQSAALSSQVEPIADSDEEDGPKTKRQQSLEPFGHSAVPSQGATNSGTM
jgi:hypothetical protein